MMSTIAQILLWDVPVGTVILEDGAPTATYHYDQAFLTSGIQIAPLMMPLADVDYRFPALPQDSFHGLPGLLADSLPDKFGNAVIDAWLVSQGRTPESFNAVERLCYTGKRGMGALEFVPVTGPDYSSSHSIEVERLVELASDILTRREETAIRSDNPTMEQIIQVGTSAGGARAKAVVAWNEKTNEICSGQIDAGKGFHYWLMKFDGIKNNRDKEDIDDPSYTRIEYAYYLMAKNAGIQMNECRLYEENGRAHFMTLRFDREENGRKIHMQTLGAIGHFDFNNPGSVGYETASQIMRRMDLNQSEVEELYRRMVFNVYARNQDDHVKNIAFLMNRRGEWSLAPAYDMTYAYNPGGLWTGGHQMTINGKRNDVSREDLNQAGNQMGITKANMRRIQDQVYSSVENWIKWAEIADVPQQKMENIHKNFEIV